MAKKKNKKPKNLLIGIIVILIVIIVVAIYQIQEKNNSDCREIEKAILNDTNLQSQNITCKCFSGEQYFDMVKNSTPDAVAQKANFKYILSCSINGMIQNFPVWESIQ